MSDVRKNLLAQIRRKAKSFEKIQYDEKVVLAAVAKAVIKLDDLPGVAKSQADFSITLETILCDLSRELKKIDKRVLVTARWYDEDNVKEVKDLRILGIEIKWSRDARGEGIPPEELYTVDRLFMEGYLG